MTNTMEQSFFLRSW